MRTKFAIVLAIAAVCVTTAWASWTPESLVTGSLGVWRTLTGNQAHKVVFGTDGVGHLVWAGGGPLSEFVRTGIWYNRYNPGSGSRPGYWSADFGIAPLGKKENLARSEPCIALDGDGRTIHVVWRRRGMGGSPGPESICYRRCTQDRRGNNKWDPVVHLYAAKAGSYIQTPVVACVPGEANHVLVSWHDDFEVEAGVWSFVVRFREFVNGAWTDVVRLDSVTRPGEMAGDPSIAAAPNGDVFVAYAGFEEGTSGTQIFVKTRANGVWGEPVNVAKNLTGIRHGCYTIEVNPITNNPHVVFERDIEVPNGADMDTVHAVCHTWRSASGDWLTTPELISTPRRKPFSPGWGPTMAFGGNGAARVVWYDTVPFMGDGIMYGYCPSEGGTWSLPELLISYPRSDVYLVGQFISVEEPAHIVRVVWLCSYSADGRKAIWWKSNYLGGGGSQAQPVALSQSAIELFPNPAKAGRVTVQFAPPHAGPMAVTLLDVSGRTVHRSSFIVRRSGEGSFALDVRGLNAGVYVLKLESGATSQTRKLVIQ